MENIGIAAPINWQNPDSQFNGNYFRKVKNLAIQNKNVNFYIIDIFSLNECGQLVVYDMTYQKRSMMEISRFDLIHFLELERFLELQQTFHEKWAEVLASLDLLERFNVPCVNTIASIRYSMSKMYLFDLEAAGIPVIPTKLIDATIRLDDLKKIYSRGRYIAKPLRGECGRYVLELGQVGYNAYRSLQQQDDRFLLQPLQEDVRSGEVGLLFYGNQLAHAVIRKPHVENSEQLKFPLKLCVEPYLPTEEEISFGLDVFNAFKLPLHIYRVDFIRTQYGLALMEVEAVDPFHYGHLDPNYAKKIGKFYREQLYSMSMV